MMASIAEPCLALPSLSAIHATKISNEKQTHISPNYTTSGHVQTEDPFDEFNDDTPEADISSAPSQLRLALPQNPGPNGSRVKKRPSIPRLGDLSNIKIRLWGHDVATVTAEEPRPSVRHDEKSFSKPASPGKQSISTYTPFAKPVVSPQNTVHTLGKFINLIPSSNVSSASQESEEIAHSYITPDSTPPTPSRASISKKVATRHVGTQLQHDVANRNVFGGRHDEVEDPAQTEGQHETEAPPKSSRLERYTPLESHYAYHLAHATKSPVQNSIDSAALLLCKQAVAESTPKADRHHSNVAYVTDTPPEGQWRAPPDWSWSTSKNATPESKLNTPSQNTDHLGNQAMQCATTTRSLFGYASVTEDSTVGAPQLPVSLRRDGSYVTTDSIVQEQKLCIKAQFKSQVLDSIRDEAPIVDPTSTMTTAGVGYLSKEIKFMSLQRKLSNKGILKNHDNREVHAFVDMSNIFIGFQDAAKLSNGHKKSARVRFSPFSFEHLAYILERDRPVAIRRLAGSVRDAYQQLHHPKHFLEAASLGYDCHVLRQVEKIDTSNAFNDRLQMNDGAPSDTATYWTTTSGDESSDGPGSSHVLCPRTKLGEQGVDENLHLAMQDSLLDASTPGVMVLATGDAQPAEFSQGFAHYAIKALERGWNIEIVSWRRCLSSEWKKSPFKDKYAQQVRIIELNSFLHELRAD
jgi:hypothetical protein